ncbi:MAG: hypothetical protein A2Z27_06355 [candidate division Zixibacteria bacterium RBG_16_50_21]|nr:MAG: hypothetical protein A2Z27_06355 [candidate division Zixibacteria bacterium RBG_16_50_21]
MGRVSVFLFGVISYVAFLIAFLYAIGFVGNLVVPKSIDSGEPASTGPALIINALLLSLFAIQHSVMARQGFKKWWTKLVPRQAERSIFVLLASLLLLLLYWQWRPLTGVIWEIQSPTLQTILRLLFWLGWGTVLLATFMVNHFDLFGLRQVYLHLKGKEYTPVGFRKLAFYKFVRHPIMLGFIIAFWATPRMTAGHLIFAFATTAYILIALQLEERDMITLHGEDYLQYRREVSMLVPIPKKK